MSMKISMTPPGIEPAFLNSRFSTNLPKWCYVFVIVTIRDLVCTVFG